MARRLLHAMRGHLWTIGPQLLRRPRLIVAERPWATDDGGPVRLSGSLVEVPEATGLAVILHGLGGRPTSRCCVDAAAALARQGLSSLRLAARCDPRQGPDYRYDHLATDLRRALATPACRDAPDVYVLGFSVGGAAAVRIATDPPSPRLRAVAAVSPPIDDRACEAALQWPSNALYRRFMIRRLTAIHRAGAAEHGYPAPGPEALSARGVREWERIVSGSQRPPIERPRRPVQVPTLIVASREDPLVPAASIEASAPDGATLRWGRGGHIYFNPRLDLGFGPARGLSAQIAGFFDRHRSTP